MDGSGTSNSQLINATSPGPDGFTFAFIKEFWYLIKHEVRIMFDQFHGNEVVPRSFFYPILLL